MELKEFVKSILKDVTEAVEESRGTLARDMYLDSNNNQRTVEFDIAVTVEDSTTGTGKAGIRVFQLIEGGGEVSKEAKNSSVSRIQFGVHVDRWNKAEQAGFEAKNNQYLNPKGYNSYE
jgi:hypothetical protein